MGATNHTKNLGLSQFVTSDQPDWLTDYNDDMEKIDEAYGTFTGSESNLRKDVDTNTADIGTLKTNVNMLQISQNTMTTFANAINKRVSAAEDEIKTHDAMIESLMDDVDNITSKKGVIILGGPLEAQSTNYLQIYKSMETGRQVYIDSSPTVTLDGTSDNFYNMLQSVAATVVDKNNIGKIIILLGLNELVKYNTDRESLFDKLEPICAYALAAFPFATVMVGSSYETGNNAMPNSGRGILVGLMHYFAKNYEYFPLWGYTFSSPNFFEGQTDTLTAAGANFWAKQLYKLINGIDANFFGNSLEPNQFHLTVPNGEFEEFNYANEINAGVLHQGLSTRYIVVNEAIAPNQEVEIDGHTIKHAPFTLYLILTDNDEKAYECQFTLESTSKHFKNISKLALEPGTYRTTNPIAIWAIH